MPRKVLLSLYGLVAATAVLAALGEVLDLDAFGILAGVAGVASLLAVELFSILALAAWRNDAQGSPGENLVRGGIGLIYGAWIFFILFVLAASGRNANEPPDFDPITTVEAVTGLGIAALMVVLPTLSWRFARAEMAKA